MSKVSASLNREENQTINNIESENKKISMKSLKDLIFLGRIERSVEINGFLFKLTTLSVQEQKDVVFKLIKIPEENRIFNAKVISLAFAVKSINLTPLDQIDVDGNFEDLNDKKINIMQELQVSVINKLYKIYEEMITESEYEVNIEEIKK
jgi:hypothetical protein